MRTLFLIYITILGYSIQSLAQDTTPTDHHKKLSHEELFLEGLKLYRDKKFDLATQTFSSLNAENPNQTAVLFNWGLSAFQNNQKGLAIGAWRKALNIEPYHLPTRAALSYAAKIIPNQSKAQDTWFERVRAQYLQDLTLNQLLFSTWILFVTAGGFISVYLGKRRAALRDLTPLPVLNWIPVVLLMALFVSLGLLGLKCYDWITPRATVVISTAVKTGPDESGSSLFEVKEGMEILIKQQKNNWTQIHSPGGMSGWVPNNILFQTSGMSLW